MKKHSRRQRKNKPGERVDSRGTRPRDDMSNPTELRKALDATLREHNERMRRIDADFMVIGLEIFKEEHPGLVITCPGFIRLPPPSEERKGVCERPEKVSDEIMKAALAAFAEGAELAREVTAELRRFMMDEEELRKRIANLDRRRGS